MQFEQFLILLAMLANAPRVYGFEDESCEEDSSSDSSSGSDGGGGGHHHHHSHGNGGDHHHNSTSGNNNRPKCPLNWFTSYRPQGIWCLRVGIGKMDYSGAIAQCATYGGILSGIQNEWERNLIANEANRQTLAYNINFSGVWLGAQRNSDGTFSWTDGHTTGTAGFVWGPAEPDNKQDYGDQNCAQLIALAPSYWNSPGFWSGWQNGQLDDYWCAQNQNPVTRMYACGMRGPAE